jgi:hypothetical protein
MKCNTILEKISCFYTLILFNILGIKLKIHNRYTYYKTKFKNKNKSWAKYI